MRQCPNCGAGAHPQARQCGVCGAAFFIGGPPRSSGMAIAGFILSFVFAPLGFILSLLGLSEINKSNGQVGGRGLAIAGIVISSVSVLLALLIASVMIPAFLRYTKRSQTTEATTNVRRLFDSSVSYFDTEWADRNGRLLPSQFPQSVRLTPSAIPCGERQEPRLEDWTLDTWEALRFTLRDPHRFSYQYDSSGVGEDAQFTISAFGDLDCDGEYSTFQRVGEVQNNEVRGGAGLFQADELE